MLKMSWNRRHANGLWPSKMQHRLARPSHVAATYVDWAAACRKKKKESQSWERKKGRKKERKKGRKEERKKGRKEEGKKGRKEERKKGRKEERKKGRKDRSTRPFQLSRVYGKKKKGINTRNVWRILPKLVFAAGTTEEVAFFLSRVVL